MYVVDGERSTFSDTSPTGSAPTDPLILPDLATVVTRLNEMSKEVPVDAPYDSPKAAEYDSQTLETWIANNSTTERFRRLAATATRPIFGAEPREISLLFTLFYIAVVRRRAQPRHLRAQLQHAHGRPGVAHRRAARRSCARSSTGGWASGWCCARRCRRIVQGRRGVRVESKRLIVPRQAGDRGPPAHAGREDRLQPRPARPARGAHPARPPGHAVQGGGGLRPSLLARQGAHRPGALAERPGDRHLRRLAARRRPRSGVRLRGRRRRAQVPRHAQGAAARPGARPSSPPSSAPRPTARATTSRPTGPRCATRAGAGGHLRTGCAGRPGRGAAPARAPYPLGGHRDRQLTGTATWTAPCAPASARRRKCWTGCETRRLPGGGGRLAARARRSRGRAAARTVQHAPCWAWCPRPDSRRRPTCTPTGASTRAPT